MPDLSDVQFYTNLMSRSAKMNGDESAGDASSPLSFTKNSINKSQSAQDIRHGISLRRVTPPKCTVTVKKNETPMMNVVLRKVEKKLLEPPKPSKHEKSPPPKKLSSAVTNAGVAVLKAKKTKSGVTTPSKQY